MFWRKKHETLWGHISQKSSSRIFWAGWLFPKNVPNISSDTIPLQSCWRYLPPIVLAEISLTPEYVQTGQFFYTPNNPRMVPPKRKGDLELRRKKVFSFFYFMKSDVGSLALLDINFSHGEERVFEMHLRFGPWMIYFLLFLGHLALGTYHLCLRISALTFGDVCWIHPFIFNNDTPLLLQNKIRLVSPLKEIYFFKN